MATTLLERAKAHRVPYQSSRSSGRDTKQLEQLAVAWFRGAITFTQASVATGVKGSSLYGLLAVALRRGIEAGRIKIV